MKRVVVTGMGAITPIGNTVEDFWEGIKNEKCGIAEITAFSTEDFKVKLAAEVKEYEPEEYFQKREAKRMDRFSQFAVIAAKEALKDSKLIIEKEDPNRIGVFVGSGIGGLRNYRKG